MSKQYSNLLNIAATEFDFEDVERFFDSSDCRWKLRPGITRSLSMQDQRLSVQSGGAQPAAGVFYRPDALGGLGFDHLFTSNMADGWDSLLVSISAHARKRCVAIRYAEPDIREFKILHAGECVRVIQAIKDGRRWEFHSTGEAFEFEEQNFYGNRWKKNRLPWSLLVRYFKCCTGFALSDPDIFRSDGEVLRVLERRA